MEADAGQSRPFQDSLQHVQDAVRGHGAACWRWEYPFAAVRLAPLYFQNVYRICRQRQCAVGVFRFQRCFHYLAVLPRDGSLDFQYATVKVYIYPLQPQQFPTAQARCEVEVIEFVHAAVSGFLEEGAELVGGQRFHFFVFDFW